MSPYFARHCSSVEMESQNEKVVSSGVEIRVTHLFQITPRIIPKFIIHATFLVAILNGRFAPLPNAVGLVDVLSDQDADGVHHLQA